MDEAPAFLRRPLTHEDVFVVHAAARDAFSCATEWLIGGGPARGVTVADLESLPSARTLGSTTAGWVTSLRAEAHTV